MRFPNFAVFLLGLFPLLASCGFRTSSLPESLEAGHSRLRDIEPGTYRAIVIDVFTLQRGRVVHSVLLDREGDESRLVPWSATSADSVEHELGRLSAEQVARFLPRLEYHPGAKAGGFGFHEGFRSWTLFPIRVNGTLLGYVASVDSLALFQLEKRMDAGKMTIYYQDSADFADKTGSGGGPGGSAGGVGDSM